MYRSETRKWIERAKNCSKARNSLEGLHFFLVELCKSLQIFPVSCNETWDLNERNWKSGFPPPFPDSSTDQPDITDMLQNFEMQGRPAELKFVDVGIWINTGYFIRLKFVKFQFNFVTAYSTVTTL